MGFLSPGAVLDVSYGGRFFLLFLLYAGTASVANRVCWLLQGLHDVFLVWFEGGWCAALCVLACLTFEVRTGHAFSLSYLEPVLMAVSLCQITRE